MRPKKILAVLSTGITVGFIVGLVCIFKLLRTSFIYIIANRYIQYRMIRLITFSFQELLYKWLKITIIISLALFIIWLLWELFFSRIIGLNIKYKIKLKIFKLKRKNIFKITKPIRRITPALVMPLLILNIGIVIDSKINIPKRPNVILIIVDTLRTDHLSCYGYNTKTSPNIDKLCMNSILFKNAISAAPWTTPSIACVFTSKYPAELGFGNVPIVLDNKFFTLAEIFKENNYKTKGIISHDYISSTLGFNQGFDEYDEKNSQEHGHISSPSIVQKAISFLEKSKNEKFLLFLHFFDPHYDFILHKDFNYYPDYDGHLYSSQPIKELRREAPYMSTDDIKYIKALYDSEISFTDEFIGILLEKLKELELYNDTMIIFTADHGEEFLERGDYWIGHARTLYQELIHVPLIIKLEGNNKRKIVNEYVGLIDLMPTIVEYMGFRIPNKYEGKIIDLSDEEEIQSEIIISETNFLRSVIWKGWKFIYDQEMDLKKLFNLRKDPLESKNIIIENRELSEKLEEILQEWNRHIRLDPSRVKATKPKFTEDQKRRLRSLGYLK